MKGDVEGTRVEERFYLKLKCFFSDDYPLDLMELFILVESLFLGRVKVFFKSFVLMSDFPSLSNKFKLYSPKCGVY